MILAYITRLIYFLRCPYRSVWGDEMWTIETTSLGWKDMFITVMNDVHPPIQYIFYKLFHYQVVPFIASLVSIWVLSKVTKDKLVMFLFAISPYFVHLSGEYRGYGLLCMFSLMVLAGWKWAFPLAVLTEHYGLFNILWVKWRKWFWLVVVLSVALILYQSGTEGVFSSNRGFDWSIFSVIKKLIGVFLHFGGGVGYSFMTKEQALGFSTYHYFLMLGHLSGIIFICYSRNQKFLKMLFIPILVLMIFYPIRLNARYLPFCGIAWIFLIVDGYREIDRLWGKILLGVYVISNVLSLGYMMTLSTDIYHREDYIKATKFVSDMARQNDGILDTRFYNFYKGRKLEYQGGDIWEICQGNPDMRINMNGWKSRLKELDKENGTAYRMSDIVYVLKYWGENGKDI